jgi:hypothetical protein
MLAPNPHRRSARPRRKRSPTSSRCVERLEGRQLLTLLELDVYPNDTTATIQAIIDQAENADEDGAVIYFHKGRESTPTVPEAYVLTAPLELVGTDSTSRIGYEGDAASFDTLTGLVTDPGTVITKPSETHHFAFSIEDTIEHPSYITIQNLTFDGCGIASLEVATHHIKITNNLAVNSVFDGDTPLYDGIIKSTYDTANSEITNNIFRDNHQISFGIFLYGGGGFNDNIINNNTFSNCAGGIKMVLGGESGTNEDNFVNGNRGTGLSDKLIEIQGSRATRLTVSGNKVSGFRNHRDNTMGLSIPINGEAVQGVVISNNEISDTPGVGISENDSEAGVRIGIEAGGPWETAADPFAMRTKITGNKIYGTVNPISLTGGGNEFTENVETEIDGNTIYYFTADTADSDGIQDDWASDWTVTNHVAVRLLPTDMTGTTVAFDAWVTGDNNADTFTVDSSGVIKDGSLTTVGTVPNNSSIPGLGPGRAVIFGMGGSDSISANTSTANPTVLARYALAGGRGVGDTGTNGTDTLVGGAGTDFLFGGSNNDSLTINMIQAAHFAPRVITVGERVELERGAGTGGTYPVSIVGTSGADDVTVAFEHIDASVGATTIAILNSEAVSVDLDSGTDTLNVIGSSGADAITFDSGTVEVAEIGGMEIDATLTLDDVEVLTFDGKPDPAPTAVPLDNVTINGGLRVDFPATQKFASLELAASANATAKLLAAGDRVLVTKALIVGEGAMLDLTNNAMIVDYSGSTVETAIFNWLDSGHTGSTYADWLGDGINSSTAAAVKVDSENYYKTGIGFNEASYLGLSTFAGMSVDSTSILIRYTYYGDADLDGDVDVADLGHLASHWQESGYWRYGDFNFDEDVDVADLGLIASNWQQGVLEPDEQTFEEAWDELT